MEVKNILKGNIFDETISTSSIWSSKKINEEISKKANIAHIHTTDEITTNENLQFVSSKDKTEWSSHKDSKNINFDTTQLEDLYPDIPKENWEHLKNVQDVLEGTVSGMYDIQKQTTDDITEGATNKFVTQIEKDKWNNSTDISDKTISSTSTWSSEKIQNEIESGKIQTKNILINNWEGPDENGIYCQNITHNLNSEKIIFHAYNQTTGLNELLSYKIIDMNNIKVFAEDNDAVNLELFSGKTATIIKSENQINDLIEATGSTWSSSKIKQEMELFLLQTPYKTLTVTDWQLDPSSNLYKSTVTHNLNSEELFISAYNTSTKASELISYTIIDANKIEVRAEDNESIDLKIIGGAINKIEIKDGGKEINDNITTATSTWSSNKILEEMTKLSDGMKNIISGTNMLIEDMNKKLENTMGPAL